MGVGDFAKKFWVSQWYTTGIKWYILSDMSLYEAKSVIFGWSVVSKWYFYRIFVKYQFCLK